MSVNDFINTLSKEQKLALLKALQEDGPSVSSADEKCDASKPLKFIAVQKFKNFIEFHY